jgi:hypothetical protein
MTNRLPSIDGDENDWGSILNAFLDVSHASDGTLKANVVGADQLQDNAVTKSKLDSPTQSIIASVASKYVKPAGGIPKTDLDGSTQTSLGKADSALQSAPVSSVAGKTGAVTLAEADVANLADDLASTEKNANKGAAGGYAPLDSSSQVPIAKIPTGTTSSTVAIGNDARITGAVQKGSLVINVMDYGAIGNGTADDTAAIQRALDAAVSAYSPGSVYFPPGTYLIKAPLVINDGNVLTGDPLGSTILINDTFVKGSQPFGLQVALYNAHAAVAWNAGTADAFEIRGLKFHATVTASATCAWLMGFANIKKAVIENCEVLTDGDLGCQQAITFYAGCKHIWVTNNKIETLTNAIQGNPLIVKNQCTTNGATTITEDIHVIGNYMGTMHQDEVFNICGEDGCTRDAEIVGNTFVHVAGGYRPDDVIAMYGTGINAATAYTKLENVVFSGNTIRADDFTYGCFQLGNGTDGTANVAQNIVIDGNTFSLAVSSTGSTVVFSPEPTAGLYNYSFSNNKIINTGSTAIAYGCYHGSLIQGNSWYGKFSQVFCYCDHVIGNYVDAGGLGRIGYGATVVKDNTFVNVLNGWFLQEGKWAFVQDNYFGMTNDASAIGIYGDTNAGFYIVGNQFIGAHASSTIIQLAASTRAPKLGHNFWNGTGTYASLGTANAWTTADR